jgi:transposase InsO family protein
VARLMKRMGLTGAVRGRTARTTISNPAAPCPLDRVNRKFRAPAPNVLWVSDFTYVATWQGFAYRTAFFAWRRGARAPLRWAPLPESAPVSEKRVGLSRCPGRRGYGRLMAPHRLEVRTIGGFRQASRKLSGCQPGVRVVSRVWI